MSDGGKKKVLVSFSGGETSAYMAQWLWRNKRDEYEMIFVFANTGQENEETLEFVQKCSDYFGFPVVWIEAVVHHGQRKGNTFKVVDFKTADRSGRVFEEIIKKHGIPNVQTPHCTRELKQVPIKKYAQSLGWKSYWTAIGIRSDEVDRMNAKKKKNKLIYPLISERAMTKPKINFWWIQQPFRLNLKGYQGNCKWCWKKSDVKLFTLANENEKLFDFPKKMEDVYGYYVPKTRLAKMKNEGRKPLLPNNFFRKNRNTIKILEEAKKYTGKVLDDAQVYNTQSALFEDIDLMGGESCEVFSECGS